MRHAPRCRPRNVVIVIIVPHLFLGFAEIIAYFLHVFNAKTDKKFDILLFLW